MRKKEFKPQSYYIIGVVAFVLCVGVVWLVIIGWQSRPSGGLEVTFLDVGQGDGVLIATPTGKQVLVDAGKPGKISRPLSSQLPFFDRSLDMVIGTHADSDHIGGTSKVLDRYRVSRVVLPDRPNDTPTYQAVIESAKKERRTGARIDTLSAGDVVSLGAGVYIVVVHPKNKAPKNPNDSSLVFKLVYGDTSFLFTGDISKSIERVLAYRYGDFLSADVLKVAHHGADTSSSQAFLSAVSPKRAVIQAGTDNQYGHPDDPVLDRLNSVSASTTCTCEVGTVTLKSDGHKVVRQK